MTSGSGPAIAGLRREIESLEPLRLVAALTLLLLLLQPVGAWDVRPWILILACLGLLAPSLAARCPFWLGLTALTGWRVVSDWPMADNHAYLLAYWCLALAMASRGPAPSQVLAWNGRLLVGLAFALATLHKGVLSPDYVDGTFFRATLVVDSRFDGLARLLGMTAPALERGREILDASPRELLPDVAVATTRSLDLAALALTWATLALEGAVALCFLAPLGSRPSRLRDALLLVFCATTYAIAPVESFGWLLVVMGLAQAPAGTATRWAYLAAFALLIVHRAYLWPELAREVLLGS